MDIYILRHGIAEPGRHGLPDEKRSLTDEGRDKLRLVLNRARSAKVAPSLIVTSPFLRAVQTAEIAAEVLGYKKPIAQTDTLVPSASAPAVWRELRDHDKEPAILLAGHEPLLSELGSYLLGSERPVLDLKKGALLCIELDELKKEPRGTLQWLLTPALAGAQ